MEPFVPTESLMSDWALDAEALCDVLRPHTGTARVFLSGACADDLAVARSPLELVAVSADRHDISRHRLAVSPTLPCLTPVDLLVMPLSVLRSWSAPLAGLVVEPGRSVRPMPIDVAVGIHAVWAQRDLLGAGDLLAAELEESHAEVLPLYLATRSESRLSGGECLQQPHERLQLLMSALLGAWGQANPYPTARVPLFERTAPLFGVSTELPASVRGMSAEGMGRLVPQVVSALEQLRAVDPVLRFWGEALRDRATAEVAAAVG